MEAELDNEEFYKNLLLAAGKETKDSLPDCSDGKYVVPEPRYVIKVKNDKDEKIFLNICTSDELPAPKDISEEELAKLIEDPDALNFRVPIGLGNPHAEVDKSGNGCTVYDVLINTKFYIKIQENNFFMGFFMTVVYEGLEEKYNTKLSRNWVKLKNRKSIGQIIPQKIRAKNKPIIQEMSDSVGLKEVSTKHFPKQTKNIPKPVYKITCEPIDAPAQYMVVEIKLPNVKTIQNTLLDVGDDKLILNVQPEIYYLDLKLPHLVDYESGGAQFNKNTKVLTITIPVLPTDQISDTQIIGTK